MIYQKYYHGSKKYLKDRSYVYAEEDAYYTGISRAWVCREVVPGSTVTRLASKLKSEPYIEDKEFFIVFNGYGHTTKTIASIFSHFSGYEVKSISITNEGKAAGGLYLNEGGYLVASPDLVKEINSYDFGVKRKKEALNAFDVLVERRRVERRKGIEPVRPGIHKDKIVPQDSELPAELYIRYTPLGCGYTVLYSPELSSQYPYSLIDEFIMDNRLPGLSTDDNDAFIKHLQDWCYKKTLEQFGRPEENKKSKAPKFDPQEEEILMWGDEAGQLQVQEDIEMF